MGCPPARAPERHVGVRHLRSHGRADLRLARPLRKKALLLHGAGRRLCLRLRALGPAPAPCGPFGRIAPGAEEIFRLRLHSRAAFAPGERVETARRALAHAGHGDPRTEGRPVLGFRARALCRRGNPEKSGRSLGRTAADAARRRGQAPARGRRARGGVPQRGHRFLGDHRVCRPPRSGRPAEDVQHRLRGSELRRVRLRPARGGAVQDRPPAGRPFPGESPCAASGHRRQARRADGRQLAASHLPTQPVHPATCDRGSGR